MIRNRYLIIFLGSLLVVMGCESKDSHSHPELKTGKELFEYHCAGCHGVDGGGNFLKGVPNNRNTDLSPRKIAHEIRKGETTMPNFPNMPRSEARKIAEYLKSINAIK